MKRSLSLFPALLVVAWIVLPGCKSSEKEKAPTASAAKPSFFADEKHSGRAEVVAVDPAARLITLREGNQEPQEYSVGKDVRNLDQVKVGDLVAVDYYESISINVLPPGELGDEHSASLARSQPGEKPGGMASSKFSRTAEVASVFPQQSEVVTRNADGNLRTWKVRDAKKLDNIQPGDRVKLTFTQLLAVSVSPAPKSTTGAAAPATP